MHLPLRRLVVDQPLTQIYQPSLSTFYSTSAAQSGHKFLASWAMFGFCMARIVSCVLRIAWTTRIQNARLAIAASIFLNLGVMVVYAVVLVLASRILRATQPRLGWNPTLRKAIKISYIGIIVVVILLLSFIIASVETLNQGIRTASLWILRPKILVPAACVQSRYFLESRASSACSSQVSVAEQSGLHLDPHQILPGFEIVVIYLFIFARFDQKFWVPNGSQGPGGYSGRNQKEGKGVAEKERAFDSDVQDIGSGDILSEMLLSLPTGEPQKPRHHKALDLVTQPTSILDSLHDSSRFFESGIDTVSAQSLVSGKCVAEASGTEFLLSCQTSCKEHGIFEAWYVVLPSGPQSFEIIKHHIVGSKSLSHVLFRELLIGAADFPAIPGGNFCIIPRRAKLIAVLVVFVERCKAEGICNASVDFLSLGLDMLETSDTVDTVTTYKHVSVSSGSVLESELDIRALLNGFDEGFHDICTTNALCTVDLQDLYLPAL
ncbi:hypothetical protein KCU59_g135, partial [Aureobasidium melanogenum]